MNQPAIDERDLVHARKSPVGIHRPPSELFKDAIKRALGWESETTLRELVYIYTGVKLSLGESNRFSQGVADIVIDAFYGKDPAMAVVAKSELCNAPNGQHPTIECTLPKDHSGLHRSEFGPEWQTPAGRGRCLHLNDKHEQCALPIDHWEAHRNWDGYQFCASEAHLREDGEEIAADGDFLYFELGHS